MVEIRSVVPTIFFRQCGSGLKRRVLLTVCSGNPHEEATVFVRLDGQGERIRARLRAGETVLDVFVPDGAQAREVVFTVEAGGLSACAETTLRPQRKWVVHVVQTSHHDPGYTDLPSLVLRQHDQWIDEAIGIAEQTDSFPDDAKFRIVLEQAWSIHHFLKTAPPDRAQKAIELMRAGRFELTALFGNMTSELCGHETLARTAYHAFALKRRYGIPIVSAEHNDITGVSWGLSRVLAENGIRIFCPGIPLYYNWGQQGMPSFWDERKVFVREGPGAFWWETPDGKRVLFWCNNSGCGGPSVSSMPGLEEALLRLEEQGYPWPVLRWPVVGGARDNSPYIGGFAQSIRQWNETWAYPRLVSSTNAMFHADLARQDLAALPVWRGELPGQDYPNGATSTAAATAANRSARWLLQSAEKLSSAAAAHKGFRYPTETLAEACEETLWHDEHAWGFHFPCGPAMRASQHEKALHAYRAEALAHGAAAKAMASLADDIALPEGYAIAVFNPTSWPCTGAVRAPMRELDNSGSEMQPVPPEKGGFLKGYVLGHRFHTILPPAMLEGQFNLIDGETGNPVPSQITEIDSPMDPSPWSEDRLGIGSGTRRYGIFELPVGLKRDLCFVARDVPAMGYRTYRLVPRERAAPIPAGRDAAGRTIENEYYRVTAAADGTIGSLYDKQAGRELVDSGTAHGFFGFIVRQGNRSESAGEQPISVKTETGEVLSTLRIRTKAVGHPAIEKTVTLYHCLKQVHFSVKVLKDPTPLLNAHLAFPFAAASPSFRYEGGLAQLDPIRDAFPGSFMDTLAAQSWVKVDDGGFSILWSSLDAPIVGLSELWPGYVSPAHRCILEETPREPQREEDIRYGWIYSQLFNNNFGTNFSVSQTGEATFRYVLATMEASTGDSAASRFGWQATEPLLPILTDRCRPGNPLPPAGGFLAVDNPNVALLAWKQAEDGEGWALRLWNLTDQPQDACVSINGCVLTGAALCTMSEEHIQGIPNAKGALKLHFSPGQVMTVKIIVELCEKESIAQDTP